MYRFSSAASNVIRYDSVRQLVGVSQATWSMWLEVGTGNAAYASWLGFFDRTTGLNGWGFVQDGTFDGSLFVFVRNGIGTGFNTTTNAVLGANTLHHLHCVFDGTQASNPNRLRVWIDGTEFTSWTTTSGDISSSIGMVSEDPHLSFGSTGWNGSLGHIGIWKDAALTDPGIISRLANGHSPLWFKNLGLYAYAPLLRDERGFFNARGLVNAKLVPETRFFLQPRLTKPRLFLNAGAAAAITAQAAITEENDLISSTATVLVTAQAAIQEENDLVSAQASSAAFAQVAVLEDDDAISAQATVAITAQAAILEENDQISAVASSGTFGQLAVLEQDDAVSSQATVAVTAQAAIQEADDAVSSLASTGIGVVADILEDGDIVVSTATVAISASLSVVEDNDLVTSIVSTAAEIFGFANIIEDDDSVFARVQRVGPARIRASDRRIGGINIGEFPN